MKLIFVMVSVFGLVMWIISYLNLGLSFGILPKPKKITRKGLYRYFDHPMYLGISTTLLSLSLLNGSTYGFVYTLLIPIPILIVRSKLESREIRKIQSQ